MLPIICNFCKKTGKKDTAVRLRIAATGYDVVSVISGVSSFRTKLVRGYV